MPVVRPLTERKDFFLDDPDDRGRLICEICSKWLNPNRYIKKSLLRTGTLNHMNSARHKGAEERMRRETHQGSDIRIEGAPAAAAPPPLPLPPPPVHLPLMRILHAPSASHPSVRDIFKKSSSGQYFDRAGNEAVFSAGQEDSEKTTFDQSACLGEGLTEPDSMDLMLDDSHQSAPSSDPVATELRQPDTEMIMLNHMPPEPEINSEWFPYPSKTMFLLDYIDNLPRLRLSDDHLRVILWVMRECGVPDVPSFYAVRKLQKDLQDIVSLKPELHTSPLSNHFYMNQPAKLLALDWSNPQVRPLMQLYPEIERPIAEFWQASKWIDESSVDDEAPMWADWDNPAESHRSYFVHELAITKEDNIVLIMKWLSVKGHISVSVRRVVRDEEADVFVIGSEDTRRIPASSLKYNIIDIRKNYNVRFSYESDRVQYPQPNPLRDIGKGKPMFRIRAMVWSDDASGNQITSQEYFVRFCSTSQYASSSEQFAALVADFNVHTWHRAYDCKLGEEILFQIIPHVLPGDNPQQSETASHIGVKANRNSRRDKVGGTEVEKETEEMYIKLHAAVKSDSDEVRRVDETVAIIKAQLRAACRGDNKLLGEMTTKEGVKDKIAQHWISQLLDKAKTLKEEMKKAVGSKKMKKEAISDKIENELWDWLLQQPEQCGRTDVQAGIHYNALLETRSIDVHKDTPVEILHMYLLGNDKYVWHQTWNSWMGKECEGAFANRLQCADLDGLTSMPPRAQYMIRFKNNLIGKHFRCLQELGIFQLHDLISPKVFSLWRTTGELGALLFFPEIQDMDEYLTDLQVLIDNLLDAWGQVDPRRIITKIKLRLMPYLIQDIRHFGPAILYATELFESYNYVFRLSSIHSNHHAPSLDIANDIAGAKRLKHIISGGWWYDDKKEWVQAGPGIHKTFERDKDMRRRVGWNIEDIIPVGVVTKAPGVATRIFSGETLSAETALSNQYVPEIANKQWLLCTKVTSQSRDTCKEGSWVFFNGHNGENSVGRITRILTSRHSECSWVILRVFDVCKSRDIRLNMPVLVPAKDGVILVKPSAIIFLFNAQHDCHTGKCSLSSTAGQFFKQERINTSVQKTVVLHAPLDRFIINMHALHNAHLLRRALPRTLTQPIPFHQGISEDVRRRLSAGLRVSGQTKRDATKAKVAQTRQRKKDIQISVNDPGDVADLAPI